MSGEYCLTVMDPTNLNEKEVIKVLESILRNAKHVLDYDRQIKIKIAELRKMSLEDSMKLSQQLDDRATAELRSAIRKLTTSKVQNVSDAKYGFWHHLDASSLDKIMQLIAADRKRVELEARIDELSAIYGWSQEERTPLIFYPEHRSSDFAQMAANGMGTNFTVIERIAELKQELERL